MILLQGKFNNGTHHDGTLALPKLQRALHRRPEWSLFHYLNRGESQVLGFLQMKCVNIPKQSAILAILGPYQASQSFG